MIAVNCPARIETLTASSARTTASPSPYRLVTASARAAVLVGKVGGSMVRVTAGSLTVACRYVGGTPSTKLAAEAAADGAGHMSAGAQPHSLGGQVCGQPHPGGSAWLPVMAA